MPIYEFLVSQVVVVQADDDESAEAVAREAITDLDWQAYDVELNHEITTQHELSDGWNGDCIPYGGDGNTRLKDILPVKEKVEGEKT